MTVLARLTVPEIIGADSEWALDGQVAAEIGGDHLAVGVAAVDSLWPGRPENLGRMMPTVPLAETLPRVDKFPVSRLILRDADADSDIGCDVVDRESRARIDQAGARSADIA